MRKQVLVAVAMVSLALVGLVAGCQTYDFEPVQPLAVAQTTQTYTTIGRSLRPNMMLLVDKSGSMGFAVNYSDPDCVAGCSGTSGPNPCPAGCPTRIGDMKAAMSTFLSNSGSVARMGMAPYPAGGCLPANSVTNAIPNTDDATQLQNAANNVRGSINGLQPSGGTPTGRSLEFVGNDPGLAQTDRPNFILLLTDGLPNCNDALDPATCRCSDPGNPNCTSSSRPATLCLDKDATVATVKMLNEQKNIKTIVIGFGADTAAGDGPEVLEAMAQEGGFPRPCPGGTNGECGTGTCNPTTKKCTPGFYQAADQNELARVLESIAGLVRQDPCNYALAVTPSRPELITVLVNGEVVGRGDNTWRYNPATIPPAQGKEHGEVELLGDLCEDAKAATVSSPVAVEIRFLQTF